MSRNCKRRFLRLPFMLSLVPASVSKQRHPQRCSNYSPAFLMQNAAWSAQVPERLSACRSSSREECRSRSRTMPGTPASITSACPGSPFTALCPAARPRTGRPQGSAFARYRATHNSPNYAAASLPGSCLRMAQAAAHGCHADAALRRHFRGWHEHRHSGGWHKHASRG